MAPSLDHFATDIWSKVGLAMQLGWLTVTKQILQVQPLLREGPNDIVDRPTISGKAFVIENRLAHHLPFEYEYRFTEYEYEKIRETTPLSSNDCDHPVAASDALSCENKTPQLGEHRFVRHFTAVLIVIRTIGFCRRKCELFLRVLSPP